MLQLKLLLFFCSTVSIGFTYDVYFMNKLCNQTISMKTSKEWMFMINRTHTMGEVVPSDPCVLRIETNIGRTINFTIQDILRTELNQVRYSYDYTVLLFRDGTEESSFVGYKTYDNILYIANSNHKTNAQFSLQIESLPAGISGTGYMDNHCNGTIDLAALGLESFYLKGTSHFGETYKSNQDCSLVFRSKPSEALRVELVKASIEQCKACTCDWLEIRDGDNADSQYTSGSGKICGMLPESKSITRIYNTLQNALFLRFVSDSGVVDGGFDMRISRVFNEQAVKNTVQVNCQDAGWNIQLDLTRLGQIFPGIKTSDIYLGDNSCTPTLVQGKYTFQNGFDECLTSRTVRDGVNVYANEIINVERNPQFTFLIKRYVWRFQVECYIGANGSAIMGGFENEVDITKLATRQPAGTSVNMSFYSNSNFASQILGNPLKSTPGSHVYLKVFVPNMDFDKKILLKSCFIEPTMDAADNMKYYLIQNGCEVDSNTHFIAQEDHETRLVFDYFEYAGNRNGVYVVCHAITCAVTDTTQNCIQTCNPVRKRSVFVPDMLNYN